MDIKHLKTFVTLYHAQSFSKAAALLGYAQPTVTMHIQILESDLQVKLFERLGHMVKITNEGTQLLYYAEKILAFSEQATAFFSTEQQSNQKITIGANQSFSVTALPLLLKSFIKKYPTMDIRLKFGSVQEIRTELKENTIDIAFFLTKKLDYMELIIEHLFSEAVSLAVPVTHPFAKRKSVTVADLQTETLIVTEKNCLYRNMIDEVLTAENIQPHATIATNNVQAIKELVISGVGVTILPHSTLDYEVKNNLLTKIPLWGLTPTVSTQIAYHKDKWLSPVLVRFLEEARQLYKK